MHHEHHEHHDMFRFQETSPPASKSPPGRNLIRDSGSSISITTATDQPGFLFPVVRTTPITVRRKMTEESSLSWSPDHNKSRNETRRPLNRLLPEDSGLLPHSNMLVTDVYYEDSTTHTTPAQDLDQETSTTTAQTSSSTTKPVLNPTAAANASTASTGSAISASIKVISQTTQPLFNGKTGFVGWLLNQNLTKCSLACSEMMDTLEMTSSSSWVV